VEKQETGEQKAERLPVGELKKRGGPKRGFGRASENDAVKVIMAARLRADDSTIAGTDAFLTPFPMLQSHSSRKLPA